MFIIINWQTIIYKHKGKPSKSKTRLEEARPRKEGAPWFWKIILLVSALAIDSLVSCVSRSPATVLAMQDDREIWKMKIHIHVSCFLKQIPQGKCRWFCIYHIGFDNQSEVFLIAPNIVILLVLLDKSLSCFCFSVIAQSNEILPSKNIWTRVFRIIHSMTTDELIETSVVLERVISRFDYTRYPNK